MARPLKLTLDFFVHDADASNDTKVRAISRKHGNDGYATFFRLLEVLCKQQSLQLDLSDSLVAEALSEDFRLRDTQHLYTIVQTCADIGLFDKQLWEAERVVLSPGLYRRYLNRLQERKQAAERQRRSTEAKSLEAKIQATEQLESQVITRDNPAKKRDNSPEYRDQNTELEIRDQNQTQSQCFAPLADTKTNDEQVRGNAVSSQPLQRHVSSVVIFERQFGQPQHPWQNSKARNDFDLGFSEFIRKKLESIADAYKAGATIGDAKSWIAKRQYDDKGIDEIFAKWEEYQSSLSSSVPGSAGKPISLSDKIEWEKQPCFREWLEAYQQDGQHWLRDPNGGLDQAKCNFANYVEAHGYAS